MPSLCVKPVCSCAAYMKKATIEGTSTACNCHTHAAVFGVGVAASLLFFVLCWCAPLRCGLQVIAVLSQARCLCVLSQVLSLCRRRHLWCFASKVLGAGFGGERRADFSLDAHRTNSSVHRAATLK